MTVKELIEYLEQFPEDTPVFIELSSFQGLLVEIQGGDICSELYDVEDNKLYSSDRAPELSSSVKTCVTITVW